MIRWIAWIFGCPGCGGYLASADTFYRCRECGATVDYKRGWRYERETELRELNGLTRAIVEIVS